MAIKKSTRKQVLRRQTRRGRAVAVPLETIERRIYLIRRQQVMLDEDLARLYQVETKALNRAVKRNEKRFPEDFMFQLDEDEVESLRCQFGASKYFYSFIGGRKLRPPIFFRLLFF